MFLDKSVHNSKKLRCSISVSSKLRCSLEHLEHPLTTPLWLQISIKLCKDLQMICKWQKRYVGGCATLVQPRKIYHKLTWAHFIFSGKNCEQVMENCSEQCLNGGTCMMIKDKAKCFCPWPYFGQNCSKSK